MPFPTRALRAALPLTLVLAASAAPAQAAITSSAVTASETALFDYKYAFEGVASDNTRTISGTADGDTGNPVHVLCVSPNGQLKFSFGQTTLAADDTWTIEGALSGADDPCSPRALPTASLPANLTPFAPGPLFYPGDVYNEDVGGKLTNWGVEFEPRRRGYADYYSLGSCGLCDAQWRNDAGVRSDYLWYYNASVGDTYQWDADGSGPEAATALPLATVDGQRARAPYNVQNTEAAAGVADPDFVPLTFSHSLDPETGDTTTESTEALMTCPGGCGTDVVDTGIRVDRTTLYSHEGQVFRIDDVWRNTAGATRELSLRYMNSQAGDPVGVQLPGEPGFSARTNTMVGLADADAATITVKNFNANPVDPLTNPVGTITMAPAADEAVFTDSGNEFLLRHDFELAPGASRTITQTYAMGGTLEDTRALGAEAEDELAGPSVSIATPADDAKVDTDKVTVTGTATDTVGVASVEVNGVAASRNGDAWSATVPLKPGANTIEAVATDGAGNTASASRGVTYTPKPAAVATPPAVTPPIATPPGVRPVTLLARLTRAARARATGARGTVLVDTGLDVSCPAGGPACTAGVSATGLLPVKAKKKRKAKASAAAVKRRRAAIGRKTLRIPAGTTQRIRIRLSPAASRELRSRRTLAITMRIVTRVGTAAATTSNQRFSVRAPARRRARG